MTITGKWPYFRISTGIGLISFNRMILQDPNRITFLLTAETKHVRIGDLPPIFSPRIMRLLRSLIGPFSGPVPELVSGGF
jgi:hypothetical protein